jgi:transposase
MNSIRYVGLDVHRTQITWCMLDGGGQLLGEGQLGLTQQQLDEFAGQRLARGDQVALETTTNCWAVASVLKRRVARVVVSNPMATKAIALSKKKTDKVDARVLADLLRCDYLPEVWQPDEATQQQRELTRRRAGLVRQRTALRNRIHGVLAMRLVSRPVADLFSPSGMSWLKGIMPDLDAQAALLIGSDLRLLEALQGELELLELELARRGWEDAGVRLLMTLPGVNVAVAEGLLAAWGDVNRFADADSAVSYLGLAPSTRQSGLKCHHGGITKQGNKQARWLLIQAAQQVVRHPGPLGYFFAKLKRRKNHNIAVVATARKLARIAWYMLRHNEPYRYAQPRSTQDKLARLRIRVTGQRRKGRSLKGQPRVAKLPGGSRTIKPLARVYEEEGLPGLPPATAGERHAVAASGAAAYVAGLDQEHVIPRRSSRGTEPARAGQKRKAQADAALSRIPPAVLQQQDGLLARKNSAAAEQKRRSSS